MQFALTLPFVITHSFVITLLFIITLSFVLTLSIFIVIQSPRLTIFGVMTMITVIAIIIIL